ncbi:MAG: hypothetical protein WCA64_00835 [Gallionella sp.]
MKTKMDVGSHQIERYSIEEYDYDILYAVWNPEVDSVMKQLQVTETQEQQGMPTAFTTKVAE